MGDKGEEAGVKNIKKRVMSFKDDPFLMYIYVNYVTYLCKIIHLDLIRFRIRGGPYLVVHTTIYL